MAFFVSDFTAKTSFQEFKTLETREEVWKKEDFCLVEEEQVRDRLSKVDTHISIGLNEIHL